MAINDILKYTSKDYNSIFDDLMNIIPSLTDKWTNTEDGDPGVVLVKLMSALGDMLSYNMDKQALEYYSPTVTQRKNASKLFNLIGYKMHWYQSATNTITVTNQYQIEEHFNYVTEYENKVAEDDKTNVAKEYFKTYLYSTRTSNYYPDTFINKLISNCGNNLSEDSAEYIDFEMSVDLYNYLKEIYDNIIQENTITINNYISDIDKTINVSGSGSSVNNYIIVPTTNRSETIEIKPNSSPAKLSVIQGSLLSTPFTVNQLRNNRFYFSEYAIDDSHIWVSYVANSDSNINTNNEEKFIDMVDNLMTVTDDKPCFQFGVDEFDIPFIEFPNYFKSTLNIDSNASQGEIAQFVNSVTFRVYYVVTRGYFGNITKNHLTTISNLNSNNYTITHPANTTPYIDTNGNLLATPGQHPETAKEAYKNSINYVTTFNTLVTIYDFERFCIRQQGISNAFAVDIQRATDLVDKVRNESVSLSKPQLKACLHGFKVDGNSEITDDNIQTFRTEYCNRKYVQYNDSSPKKDTSKTRYAPADSYKKYGLNLHVIYKTFDTHIDNYEDENNPYEIATMTDTNTNYPFWKYCLISEYEEDNSNNINCKGGIAKYLDKELNKYRIINVQPEYAIVRVFPWRCCGVIHLTNLVTQKIAETIIQDVINNLSIVFHPSNLTFGERINYMDVINAVMESNALIKYFDAGLGDRKLIDIDEHVDDSYFNSVSMFYYVQNMYGETKYSKINYLYGNEQEYIDGNRTIQNPYYKLLSISPEYIISE